MSHYLIVELSEQPVDIEDRISAYGLEEDQDIQYAADYVQDLEDNDMSYEEAVEDFLDELEGIAIYNKEDNSITFTDTEKYFEEDFKAVKDMVANATLENFIDDSWAYKLRKHIRDQFGTYIHHTGECSWPISEFLREYAKKGAKFYIGGICDYHC